MTWYILVSTILLMILAIIWDRKNALNMVVKMTLIALSVWGAIEYGLATGYIVRVH